MDKEEGYPWQHQEKLMLDSKSYVKEEEWGAYISHQWWTYGYNDAKPGT